MLCPHPCYEAQGGGNANGQEGLHVMVHYDLSNLFEKSRSLWCFNPLLSEAKNNTVWSDNDGFVSCDTAYVNPSLTLGAPVSLAWTIAYIVDKSSGAVQLE